VIPKKLSQLQQRDAVSRVPQSLPTKDEDVEDVETTEDIDRELKLLLRRAIPDCKEEPSMNPQINEDNTGAPAQSFGDEQAVLPVYDETETILDELGDEEDVEDGTDADDIGDEDHSVSSLHKVDVTVLVTIPLDNAYLGGLQKQTSKVEIGGRVYDFYRPFRPAKKGAEIVGSFRSVMVPMFRSINGINASPIMYVGGIDAIGDSVASVLEAIEGEVVNSLDSIGDAEDVIAVLGGDDQVESVEPVSEIDEDFDYDEEVGDDGEEQDAEVVTLGDMISYGAWINSSEDNTHNVVIQVVVQDPSLYDAEDKGKVVSGRVKFFNTLKDREGSNINMYLSFGLGIDNILQPEVRGGMIDALLAEEFQVYTPSHSEIISDGGFDVELPLPMDEEDFASMMGDSSMMFIKAIGQEQVDD
jgi:hypothetical protein